MALRIQNLQGMIKREQLSLLTKEKIDTLAYNHIAVETELASTLYCYEINHRRLAYDSICDYFLYLNKNIAI